MIIDVLVVIGTIAILYLAVDKFREKKSGGSGSGGQGSGDQLEK